ncbi:SIMPL domain-containing protein [Marinobacter daepoensis]|uniref:SIMPL domain-containing protein n=1 Tax=Marinobacter daepoensis TaxID=262077 RepID=A0ABS3BFZ4_9GAMM|nr:SIMPL domain-containing protein [Marinobacter daepoensis]MBN7769632.1 SIMPL domain-containing protein [Marinobacter daepoensis]MBY6031707.1 SIMPL domain-containing protein [Marinobacter daepoensis]MBY6078322.1 SIMPL domain-containing protein [Marinobacter daepoensis]
MFKSRFTGVIAAALMTLPATTLAGEVSLSGEGSVRYEPDSARLQFTARAEHSDAKTASETVGNVMAEWRKAIGTYRSELNDYSDADLSVYTRMIPTQEKDQDPKQMSVASQTVSFSISDLSLLNPLIEKANGLGLQYHLGSHQFFHSDEQGMEREALARAIADVKSRCEFVAQQLEQQCGEVVTLNINGGHRPVPMMRAEAKMVGDAVSSVGPREVSASVHATFELD